MNVNEYARSDRRSFTSIHGPFDRDQSSQCRVLRSSRSQHRPMPTLLRPVTTFVLLLSACLLSAQTMTESYIELTVSDTLSSKIKRITYTFTPQAAEMHSDAVYEESEDWEKVQQKVEKEAREAADKLKSKLTKEGFKLTDVSPSYDDYTISSYEDASEVASVNVELTNEADLKKLVTYLRKESKGDGNVSRWEYEPSNGSEVDLMQRLHKRAEEQARTLATLGGRKLGKLITAHAPGSGTGLSWLDSIMEMAKQEMMKSEFGRDPEFFNLRERSLTFRFALVD